ncbi:PEP-CTERM sorting domain-containing protein [Cyanobacteria bacterium FACHB-472]|nr:PEP-CTERM sorting domain-containing protein [Cyanobacteria bacterium FACHB-472]
MRNYHLPILLGLTTTVAVYAPLPVQAEPKTYQEVSGIESIRFESEGLAILESLGLSLASVEGTAEPAPGFPYAWNLIPPSSDPNIKGTTFTFSYDDETGVYIPISGTEEFSGRIAFNVDTNKLAFSPQIEFKDFSISFNQNFDFFVETPGLRLFDIESSGLPTIDLENQTWSLGDINLIVSQEFSDYLVNAGASQSIAGLKLLEAQGERDFIEADSKTVNEPGSVLAILAAASAALAVGKCHRSAS